MTKDEALRLALEVLADLGMKHYENTGEVLYKNTYTAIKAALEAKDEPVVLNGGVPAMLPKQKEGETFIVSYEPKLEAKDEPVATKNNDGVTLHLGWDDLPVGTKLYATPPQRKPLTDEKMKTVVEQELVNYWDGEYIDTTGARDCLTNFARAIEAAHGIKGEA